MGDARAKMECGGDEGGVPEEEGGRVGLGRVGDGKEFSSRSLAEVAKSGGGGGGGDKKGETTFLTAATEQRRVGGCERGIGCGSWLLLDEC